MSTLNCWEYFKCGREAGGANTGTLGVCPAFTATHLDGRHNGTNGGRLCWTIAGTHCGGVIKGTEAEKLENCLECRFYTMVMAEEYRIY